MTSDLKSILPPPDADGASFKTTPNGDEALSKGSQIYAASSVFGFFGIQAPSTKEIETLGKKKLLVWFGTFYKRLMVWQYFLTPPAGKPTSVPQSMGNDWRLRC